MKLPDNLRDCFDGVVMLTWSDWNTEPRSNRYHYASRFAREFPVLFLQGERVADKTAPLRVEGTALENLELVHTTWDMSREAVHEFRRLLDLKSVKRPMFWIYDVLHYKTLLEEFPNSIRALHATEDYFTPSRAVGDEYGLGGDLVRQRFTEALQSVDLVVAVSQGVADSIVQQAPYSGRILVAENGVDADFFLEIANGMAGPKLQERPTAIFQGGVNNRLDFVLLQDTIRAMPDWDFWFCGNVDETLSHWKAIQELPNVRTFGVLEPRELGERMCQATVGIIPFVDDPWIRKSFPLKAFEYVACGLPVVTTPIDALEKEPELFSIASTSDDFVTAIRRSGETRYLPDLLELRKQKASENSYDLRFANVAGELIAVQAAGVAAPKRLNVLVLYDENSTHINTILDHLKSFKEYSKHDVHYLTATGKWPIGSSDPSLVFDVNVFDAIVVHYTVRICFDWHMHSEIADLVAGYGGLKVLFIQDEYNTPEVARHMMERLKFDVVYTCVPPGSIDYVYPADRFPNTEFLPTLTGYISEDADLETLVTPIKDREVRISYRGRKLPYIYGSLGNEKYEIGVNVKRLTARRGVRTDIEVDDSLRLFGADWFRFLGSARATLGTESGSNVFDFDGRAKAAIDEIVEHNSDVTFDEVFDQVLAPYEAKIRMNQVSPKIFEAIRMRTALILFEGNYSGVVEPFVHYLPLKKDYSNLDEILEKLEDVQFLEELTQRAYDDVIAPGKYSYSSFIEGVDSDLEHSVYRAKNFNIFSSPVFASRSDGEIRSLLSASPHAFGLSQTVLVRGIHERERIIEALPEFVNASELRTLETERSALESELAEAQAEIDRLVADLNRSGDSETAAVDAVKAPPPSLAFRGLRYLWRRLPRFIHQSRLRRSISNWSWVNQRRR